MTMDILSEEIVMEKNPFMKTRFFKALRTALSVLVRAAAAYCIAIGFWYLAISVNGLVRYSLVARTGMEAIAIGIFIILYVTGDFDV